MILSTEINTHDIMVKIDLLHSKTNCRTFYELFNVSENASIHTITKAFRVANKQTNPYAPKLSNTEHRDLIMTAYGTLKNHREAYDHVLGNSKHLFINHKENYKNGKLTVVMFSIVAIVAVDLGIFVRNYFVYQAGVTKQKKDIPRMYLYSLFRKVFARN